MFTPSENSGLVLELMGIFRSYYIMIIVNFMSGLLFFLYYYPPTFSMKFGGRTKREQLRDLDYTGIVLFIGGFLIFLLGRKCSIGFMKWNQANLCILVSWGGSVYAWKSAHVIVTIVVGAFTLAAFVLWESYAKLKEPLLPIHLFKKFSWVAACILLGLGASIYYALAIIWPQMVDLVYTEDGGASMYAGWLACTPTAMINGGQIFGGFLAEPIGKTKFQCMSVLAIGGAFLGGKHISPFSYVPCKDIFTDSIT